MIETMWFLCGFAAGMFLTLICCFCIRLGDYDDDDELPLVVATETEVDSSQVTIYEFEDEEDL